METIDIELQDWQSLIDGLKQFGEREVVAIRKDMEWTLKMIQQGKMRVQKEWIKVEIGNIRRELEKLGVLV